MLLERDEYNEVEAVNSSFGQVLSSVASPETSSLKHWGSAVGRLGAVSSHVKAWQSCLSFPGATEQTKKHYLNPCFRSPLKEPLSEVWDLWDPLPALASPHNTQ